MQLVVLFEKYKGFEKPQINRRTRKHAGAKWGGKKKVTGKAIWLISWWFKIIFFVIFWKGWAILPLENEKLCPQCLSPCKILKINSCTHFHWAPAVGNGVFLPRIICGKRWEKSSWFLGQQRRQTGPLNPMEYVMTISERWLCSKQGRECQLNHWSNGKINK